MISDREGDLGIVYPRPVELGKIIGLGRVGIRKGHRVACPAVEGFPEMDDLLTLLLLDTFLEILAHLPVESGLQGVLYREGTTADEE